MSTHGSLHARIRLPAGTFWGVTVSYGGGGHVAMTVGSPSFDTYLVDMLNLMQANLNALHGTGWTVSYGFGESGTGLVSIRKTGTTWAINFTSTGFRDLIGFTGNISGTAGQTQTGTLIADSVWLPGAPKGAQYKDAKPVHYQTDKRTLVSPTGIVTTLYGNKFAEVPRVSWNTVMEARARGITERGSFERWWYQSQLGEASWHEPGSAAKYYPDANSATNYVVRIPDMESSNMVPTVDNWSGLYVVEIPRMIVQP
jgi:hypothetical protein